MKLVLDGAPLMINMNSLTAESDLSEELPSKFHTTIVLLKHLKKTSCTPLYSKRERLTLIYYKNFLPTIRSDQFRLYMLLTELGN